MKWHVLLVFAVAFWFLGETPGQDANKKDADKKELAKLDGIWTVVTYERDGKKVEIDLGKVTIKDGKYTWDSGMWGTMALDSTKKPKHVDYSILDSNGMLETYQGIYEIDGDTFKDCIAPPGEARPTEFKTAEGSGHTLMILKREKPAKE
jgi:uncharacterized protein (TIGR03067 family)